MLQQRVQLNSLQALVRDMQLAAPTATAKLPLTKGSPSNAGEGQGQGQGQGGYPLGFLAPGLEPALGAMNLLGSPTASQLRSPTAAGRGAGGGGVDAPPAIMFSSPYVSPAHSPSSHAKSASKSVSKGASKSPIAR